MRPPLAICLWLLATTVCAGIKVVVEEPYQAAPDDESFVTRSVFAAERLWVLTDIGALSSVSPAERARRDELKDQRVLGICRTRGELVALTCADEKCDAWQVLAAGENGWQTRAVLSPKRERFAALHCDSQDVLVLTDSRAIDAVDPQKSLRFSQKLKQPVAATTATSKYLFVGFDAGEWGGGMVRIDRATGQVKRMEKKDSGDLCGGPLNSNCDPVTAIIPKAGRPECVLAAVGLWHLGEGTGRVVEVCETQIVEFYANTQTRKNWKGDKYEVSDPLYGLAQVGDDLLAVGLQGLYRFRGDGKPSITALPPMQEINGLWVNFDDPDVVLIQMSGHYPVPLLAPRRD